MVVLEGANATMPMLTIGNNQYLQPDYLSPTPTMVKVNFYELSSCLKLIIFYQNYFINSWIQKRVH